MYIVEIIVVVLIFLLSPLGFSPELYLRCTYSKYREKVWGISQSRKYQLLENKKLLPEMMTSNNDEIVELGKKLKKVTIFYYLSIAIFVGIVIILFALHNKGLIIIFSAIIVLIMIKVIFIYRL